MYGHLRDKEVRIHIVRFGSSALLHNVPHHVLPFGADDRLSDDIRLSGNIKGRRLDNTLFSLQVQGSSRVCEHDRKRRCRCCEGGEVLRRRRC